MTKAAIVLRFLFLSVALLAAQSATGLEQKGAADVDYKRGFDREDRRDAIDIAMRNAVETWVAEKQQSQYGNYERVKSQIDADIRGYVLSHTVIDEEQDKKNRNYRVVVRANLNEPKLLKVLLSPSGNAATGDEAFMTIVFVARQQVGSMNESSKAATQGKDKVQTIGRERSEESSTQTKSQSQTISMNRRDSTMNARVIWDVTTSNEIDSAMGEVFSDARYNVIPSSMVGADTGNTLNVEQLIDDYSTGNDIRPDTRRESYRRLSALRNTDEQVEYLVMGTLDVESTGIDEKTGNYRVVVAVTGEVLSVLKRGIVVAKVGPETAMGEGATELMARNNALNAAARKAAGDLVAKLSSRDIR